MSNTFPSESPIVEIKKVVAASNYVYRFQCALCKNKKLKATYYTDTPGKLAPYILAHFPNAMHLISFVSRKREGSTRWQRWNSAIGWR